MVLLPYGTTSTVLEVCLYSYQQGAGRNNLVVLL
jgi:hypothetical protein